MWLTVIKILLLVHLVSECCLSYQYSSNLDYIDSRWRSRFQATTTPSWYKNAYRYQVTAKTTTTTTTTERPHHIRHNGYNSRYPRLDGVLNRLGSYHTTTTTKKPSTKSWDSYYRRTSSDVDRVLDDNYEDLDYNEDDIDDLDKEDNLSEYDKWGNDDDDSDYQEEEEENDDEDDVSSLFDDDWQAEEATEAPASSSSLTEYKWRHYGTRSRVEESRRLQMQKTASSAENAADAAVSHYLKVASEGKCRTPIPKVLSVQSEHPSPGKTYIPHCTILHRCSEDSGCCQNHAKQCGPKNQTIVHLYFYAHMIYEAPRVEKLAFVNHTECDCIDKTQLGTANTITSGHMALKSGNHPPPENLRRCKCPGQFMPRHRFNLCTCDCSDANQDCERMQRGKEYFSLKDRICIKSGQCSTPICEYGSYLTDVGRCPKKTRKVGCLRQCPPALTERKKKD